MGYLLKKYDTGYIDNNGNIAYNDNPQNWHTTNYYGVTPSTNIIVKSQTPFSDWRVILYDKDKNFIRRVTQPINNTTETGVVAISENEMYIRFSARQIAPYGQSSVCATLEIVEV